MIDLYLAFQSLMVNQGDYGLELSLSVPNNLLKLFPHHCKYGRQTPPWPVPCTMLRLITSPSTLDETRSCGSWSRDR